MNVQNELGKLTSIQLVSLYNDFVKAYHYDPVDSITERLKVEWPGVSLSKVENELLKRLKK